MFVGIERNKEAIIPNGETIILDGDKVSVCATPAVASKFLDKIGIYQSPIKNCFIVGGSDIAFYLAIVLHSFIIVKLIVQLKLTKAFSTIALS